MIASMIAAAAAWVANVRRDDEKPEEFHATERV